MFIILVKKEKNKRGIPEGTDRHTKDKTTKKGKRRITEGTNRYPKRIIIIIPKA